MRRFTCIHSAFKLNFSSSLSRFMFFYAYASSTSSAYSPAQRNLGCYRYSRLPLAGACSGCPQGHQLLSFRCGKGQGRQGGAAQVEPRPILPRLCSRLRGGDQDTLQDIPRRYLQRWHYPWREVLANQGRRGEHLCRESSRPPFARQLAAPSLSVCT